MINRNTTIQKIEKEQIPFLNFPTHEVLLSKKEQHNRCLNLKRAMSLGNLEREKVKILFVDNDGFKRVETTVWGVTNKSVILKKSMTIPLECILSIS
ncbi:hypothetical protein GTQ40_09175 [Flavobacteriaceae bacterium R38]|nr:hypothetical protein [Flavobacteriaceae bacterium R38]